jgi:hypothetical protein
MSWHFSSFMYGACEHHNQHSWQAHFFILRAASWEPLPWKVYFDSPRPLCTIQNLYNIRERFFQSSPSLAKAFYFSHTLAMIKHMSSLVQDGKIFWAQFHLESHLVTSVDWWLEMICKQDQKQSLFPLIWMAVQMSAVRDHFQVWTSQSFVVH